MIKISSQEYISELGKRNNNEDNFGLNKGLSYVVCDGVGGSEKGEIASEIAVRCFVEAFKENVDADANDVLKNTEDKLSAYINDHPEALGMATTLTFSQIRPNGIYLAWVGDSRIYQFRNGAIVFKTTDHSWVNDALKAGIINANEAINHPKSNIITRAVQGSHKPTTADTRLLTDVKKGDLILHCSDGVLESWDDDSLKALFSSENEPKAILEIIKKECNVNSKDNFTAIVYKIEDASIIKTQSSNQPTATFIDAIPLDKNEFIANKNTSASVNGVMKVKILGLPLFAWLCFFIPIAFYFFLEKAKPPKHPIVITDSLHKIPGPATANPATSNLTYNLDSLKKIGWKTDKLSKPANLKGLEDSLKIEIEQERREKDVKVKDSLKATIKKHQERTAQWHYDSLQIGKEYYYLWKILDPKTKPLKLNHEKSFNCN
jgi:serine/threonine protein phosphatase PrpC